MIEHDIDVTIMRCPITKQALVYRGPSLLETLDGRYAYPIENGIFLLTAGNAIQLIDGEGPGSPVRQEKVIVRNFYDDFGWKLNDSGIYNDTALWTESYCGMLVTVGVRRLAAVGWRLRCRR